MGKPGLVDAAPAAVFRKRRLGGPWVAVRAHYGRCLQWLDGPGEGWAKACLDGELARACARKNGPRVEEVAAMERPKGAFCTTKARLSALHLPSKRGDQLKAQLARRRENAKLR